MFVKGSLVSVYANNGSLDEKFTRGEPLCMYTTIWVPTVMHTSLRGPLVYAYSFSEFSLHALEQFLGRFVDLLCSSFCLLLNSICDILYGCCNRFVNDINQ